MDHQKVLPHPKLSNEKLLATWDRGYVNIELWHNNRSVLKAEKFTKENASIVVEDDILGVTELYLSSDPYTLNLKIDGLHSPINSEHPSKTCKTIANWLTPGILFYFIALLVSISLAAGVPKLSELGVFVLVMQSITFVIFIGAYVAALWLSPLYYLIGFLLYQLHAIWLVYMVVEFQLYDLPMIVLTSGYLLFSAMSFLPLKRLNSYRKHLPYMKRKQTEIIDD